MKKVSIIRKVDVLGRILLPHEFRKRVDIKRGDKVEVVVSNGTITINKYKRGCMFCRREKVLISYKGYKVCMNCLSILESMKTKDNF